MVGDQAGPGIIRLNLATESFESYTEELKESKEGSKQNALCFGLEKGVTIC